MLPANLRHHIKACRFHAVHRAPPTDRAKAGRVSEQLGQRNLRLESPGHLPPATISLMRPRRAFTSPITSPRCSSGAMISTFMMGSNSSWRAARAASRKAMIAAERYATSVRIHRMEAAAAYNTDRHVDQGVISKTFQSPARRGALPPQNRGRWPEFALAVTSKSITLPARAPGAKPATCTSREVRCPPISR
jgi:hypothetical protein